MSTSNSLKRFLQDVKQGFNQKKCTLAVFINFKGAYDTLWRSKLISKLKMYGVRGNMLSWYGRFLTQSWVKVQWDEAESKYKQSKIGILQQDVSSAILFNVYINDQPKHLKKIEGIEVSMFVDNVVIWASAKNNNKPQRTLEKTMNHSLEVLNSWAKENNMNINKLKTTYQFFSLWHKNADFSLKIDDHMLQKSASTIHQGVLLDNKLDCEYHISKTVKKTNKRLGLMKKLEGATWGNSQDTLNITYQHLC